MWDYSRSQCILDLKNINEERKKLPDAKKVTIYLEDVDYLANKWKRRLIDFDFVEIRRAEEYECSNYF